jgi:hypothetical protein
MSEMADENPIINTLPLSQSKATLDPDSEILDAVGR